MDAAGRKPIPAPRHQDIAEVQARNCAIWKCAFVPPAGSDVAGLASGTLGQLPVNGLRHSASDGTSGWYIWCGERFSQSPDFFEPICIDHLIERLPLAAGYLALPPGYRFLVADGYSDVWFDASLLEV